MLKVYTIDCDYGRLGVQRESIIARDSADAAARIEARGGQVIDLKVLVGPTLNLLLSHGFNPRELSQVYRSLGRRIAQGARLEDAFRQAASFVSSAVLKVVLEDARAGVVGGMRLDEAMRTAGLPAEDTALVRAMGEGGGVADAFTGLADDYTRRATLRGRITGVLWQPVIYTLIGLVMVWSSFMFLVPRFAAFFVKAGLSPPPLIEWIYRSDQTVVAHFWLSTILYVGVFAALAWFLAGTDFMRAQWRKAPILRNILARADAAQALGAFALLYESAIRRSEAARKVAESCSGTALRDAFIRFGGELDGGSSDAEAARRSDFPEFIAPTMIGALEAHDPESTIEDLRVFSRMLTEDVDALSKKLETAGQVVFLALTAVMVLLVFLLTIYPELSTVLSNA